jgi:GntR family transcriptional regulator
MTFSREMRRQGRVPSSRIVERAVRTPDEDERVDLRVARNEQVIELRRVRLADGAPVAVEVAVLATRCVPAVLAADLETGSLHEALINAGIVPSRGKSSIGAEAASADDAALLDVVAGEPMLVERRLIFDQRGRPFERTESRYAADRYGLNVGFSVEDSGTVTVAPEA